MAVIEQWNGKWIKHLRSEALKYQSEGNWKGVKKLKSLHG